MSKKIYKILTLVLCLCLLFEQTGFAQMAGQLDISGYLAGLRNPFIQNKFRPLHLRYLSYDAINNNFRLLLDKGDQFKKGLSPKGTVPIEEQTKELLNYFFVGLTLPNDAFWVNLRPDSPDNIIDDSLAQTDIGRILLEADLQLKKDTAKFTSPQTPEGRDYWNKLYQKAGELFGSENITIPTLTRPWIVPDEVIITESNDGSTTLTTGNAYIYKATLKVCLEQDYLKDSSVYNFKDERLKQLNEYSSQLIRERIIPKLTQEINTSKRYAPLRQVYYSLILSQWFKRKFKGLSALRQGLSPSELSGALLKGTVPKLIDSQNLTNLTSKEPWSKNTYFQEYQKSFKDGEYNIKEPVYYTPYSAAGGSAFGGGQTIRSYFSGGIKLMTSTTYLAGNLIPQGSKHLAQAEFYGNPGQVRVAFSSSPVDDLVMKERAEIALRSVFGHALLEPVRGIFSSVVIMIELLKKSTVKQKIAETTPLYNYIDKIFTNLEALPSGIQNDIVTGIQVAEQLSQIKDRLIVMQKGLKDKLEGTYSTDKDYIKLMTGLSELIDIFKTQADFITSSNTKDEVDINKLITKSVPLISKRLMNRYIRGKGIEVKLEEQLPIVKVNSRLLKRILGNLISNAGEVVRERKQGGEIVVATKFDQADNKVLITVSDNGKGIAPEMRAEGVVPGRAKMFDLNASTREKGGGLGLAEAWYAVKDMGGTIDAQSEPGKGTTFIIQLPIASSPVTKAPKILDRSDQMIFESELLSAADIQNLGKPEELIPMQNMVSFLSDLKKEQRMHVLGASAIALSIEELINNAYKAAGRDTEQVKSGLYYHPRKNILEVRILQDAIDEDNLKMLRRNYLKYHEQGLEYFVERRIERNRDMSLVKNRGKGLEYFAEVALRNGAVLVYTIRGDQMETKLYVNLSSSPITNSGDTIPDSEVGKSGAAGQERTGSSPISYFISAHADWSTVFTDNSKPLKIDVGFGEGIKLLKMARANPEVNFIGIERNSIMVDHLIARLGYLMTPITNLKIVYSIDSYAFANQKKENIVSDIYYIYIDIVDLAFTDAARINAIQRLLKPGGKVYLLIITIPEYADEIQRSFIKAGFQDVTRDSRFPYPSDLYVHEITHSYVFQRPEKEIVPINEKFSKQGGISGSASSPAALDDKKGGIDLRGLPNVTRTMNPGLGMVRFGAPPSAGIVPDLDKDWGEIENLIQAGIIPSSMRIKEYLKGCYQNQNTSGGIIKALNCIAEVFRMEEERCCATEPAFKDLLILIQSNQPHQEFLAALSNIRPE